jgi:hypothetical protein
LTLPSPFGRLADGALFVELYAALDAIKNPWRNSKTRVEKKYTDDEAGHIFVLVKGFMERRASRMDENGGPFSGQHLHLKDAEASGLLAMTPVLNLD